MGSFTSLWGAFYTFLFSVLVQNSSKIHSMGFEKSRTLATLDSLHNVSILHSAIKAALLEDYINKGQKLTLFAPSDSAFKRAFKSHSLTCVHNYYLAMPCNSSEQLLESTNLRQLLLNHVVIGDFPLSLLERTELLQFAGDAVAKAQRARGRLIREVKQSLKNIDAFIGNPIDDEKIAVGNLVGMPVMVIPTGLKEIKNSPVAGTRRRTPVTTGIYGAPYHDSEVLALAMAYQEATTHHLQRPPIDDLEKHDFHIRDLKCPPVFGEV